MASEPSGALTHCFETRAVFAVPLWVSSTENERIEPIVRMQMESHGLAGNLAAEGRHLDHWIVARNGSRTQVLALWLPDDPDEWPIRPDDFAVSPQAYEALPNRILLWRELGRWVVAFTRGNRLAYFQTLSGGELDDDLIAEIACLRESIQAGTFVAELEGIEISGARVSDRAADRLSAALDLPVNLHPRPVPTIPEEPSRLLPASIAVRRESLRKQRRLSRFLLLGAILYIATAAAIVAWLFLADQENAETEAWIAGNRPKVEAARRDRQLWQFTAPAIDRDRYPLEIFSRVVSLLPEEGIRLTHFEVDLDQILIRGDASSSTEAVSWKNALLETAEPGGSFEGCRWTVPQPRILPDNQATFTAEGVLPQPPATP